MEPKELSLVDLVFTTITMLIGEEGVDYTFYEQDADWWAARLWLTRN